MTDRRSSLVVALLALAGTTFALVQAVVVPALPQLERALGTGPAGGAWILSVNLLATAVLTPILGRLGDTHGKQAMLTVVLVALGAGTLLCALSATLPVMLAGRTLQGAGGAVFPLAFGIVRDELPRERVAGAIGLVSSLLGIGAGLGLVVPGWIVAGLGWRWLFWLPLAVILVTTVLVQRYVPSGSLRTPARIDLLAAALMVAGLSLLLVAVSEASAWGWGSPRTLAVIAGGALVVLAWIRRELSVASPLVDMRMMAMRGVWTTNLAAFVLGVGMYASIALIPALVELPRSTGVGFGGSVTIAGLFMLPTAAVQLLVGPLTGHIERRIGSRAQLIAGLACLLAAYLMLTLGHRSSGAVIAATVGLGLGLGLGLGALANLIVVSVPREQTGVATAMNAVLRTLGGAFGAQVAVSCVTASAGPGGLPADGGFTLAFGLCTAALGLGVLGSLAIPRPAAAPRPAAKRPRRSNRVAGRSGTRAAQGA